ncbi:ATP-binding protein [Streptomyces reniochalinae]|uniref:ATP-binding protein n=1 Tax=Streptomyces reniochalinae TaxID=2250578 RepID=A0A367E5W8_9ACTN|nr:ATP-binding protein [Streptomyces reniochalinae]RCG13383.1 ATP-binding protein [Streptomyces reniochalinae]
MYAAPARRDPAAASSTAFTGGSGNPSVPPTNSSDPGWQLRFPAREQNIARARAAFTRWLGERHDPPIPSATADDAVLLLSELATNAVVHTRCLPEAQLVCRAAVGPLGTAAPLLRLEVHDPAEGGEEPQLQQGEAADESGRGLCIVAALAADWGVRASSLTTGNTVWATLRLADEPVPE